MSSNESEYLATSECKNTVYTYRAIFVGVDGNCVGGNRDKTTAGMEYIQNTKQNCQRRLRLSYQYQVTILFDLRHVFFFRLILRPKMKWLNPCIAVFLLQK